MSCGFVRSVGDCQSVDGCGRGDLLEECALGQRCGVWDTEFLAGLGEEPDELVLDLVQGRRFDLVLPWWQPSSWRRRP
jgi:hypothetical protein